MQLETAQLFEYNSLGLIPGPEESEEAFLKRAHYCLNLKAQIPEMLGHDLPFIVEEAGEESLKEGCQETSFLYGISPSWVPLFYSNYKLPLWQGGCAWIFQQKQDSPTAAFFQLRQKFRTSKKYLGLYDRTELMSHELSHVGRMVFEEPKFEEILAYQSSKSSFRRFFGPIIQSSYESTIFVLLLFTLLFIDFFSLLQGTENSSLSFFAKTMLACFVLYGLGRLCIRQRQYKNCKRQLNKVLFDIRKSKAVTYRLTDKEIMSFGKFSPAEIKSYAEEQNTKNLRWKLINKAYFCNPSSDHYDGMHFHNIPPTDRGFKDFLKWMISRKPHRWPKKIPLIFFTKPPIAEKECMITFVNHSTLLIQWKNLNILTDPIWSKRCGPFNILGPKRVHSPGIAFENLPPIHIVLISHNHYDHMDLPTLNRLQKTHNPFFFTGLGNRNYLENNNLTNVVELDWWENALHHDLQIVFVPAQHFSMRNPWNKNKTLWGGFVLKKGSEAIYFAGDTGYTSQFEEIKNRFGPIKAAALPIGAFEPRWFMEPAHMSPEDATKAHLKLESQQSIAIHFGTFPLSDEAIDTPVKELRSHMEKSNIPLEKFWIPQPGESLKM